jgi:hypothetical protein
LDNTAYASLSKDLELPFVPFAGLRIASPSEIGEPKNARVQEFGVLSRGCSNSTGIVIVETVTFHLRNADRESLLLTAIPVVEGTEGAIAAYVKLMRDFYGFKAQMYL